VLPSQESNFIPMMMKKTSKYSWQLTIGLLSCWYIMSVESVLGADYIPFGFQTESDNSETRSSYAADLFYDDLSREITITGGTYSNYFKPGVQQKNDVSKGSDCFVAILHLPHAVSSNPSSHTNQPSWIRRRQFGNPSASEFCSAIHVREAGGMIALGHSGPGGVLEPLLPYGSLRRSIYGMVFDLGDSVDLKGGIILHSNRFQYPVDITSDPLSGDLYLAEIISDADGTADQMEPLSDSRIYSSDTDLSTTGYTPPMYGARFSVGLKKFTQVESADHNEELSRTLEPGWSREFGTVGHDDVQVSALSYVSPSLMLLAGYTMGNGNAFGSSDSIDLDGFLTIINPEKGNVVHARRIQSTVMAGNDRLLGLCRNDAVGSSVVYLVGTTDGVFDTTYLGQTATVLSRGSFQNDAFLVKFDLNGMEVIWSRQLEGKFPVGMESTTTAGPQVHATACSVTADGENVYMAGNIKDGASLSMHNRTEFLSAGGNDIFVTKFRAADGRLEFAQQIGSDEDDSLAQGNSLATDGSGNLLLLGNTRGSMYRSKIKNGISDIFTMSINGENGDYVPTLNLQSKKDLSGNMEGDRLKHTDGLDGDGGLSEDQWARYDNAILAIGCLLGIALVLFGSTLLIRHRRVREKQRTETEDYLSWLEDDDIVVMNETHAGDWQVPHNRDIFRDDVGKKKFQGTLPNEKFLHRCPPSATDLTEDEDSVITILGKPRKGDYVRRIPEQDSYRRDAPILLEPNIGRRRESRTRKKRKDDREDPYGEIYDLLSTASQRLSSDGKEDRKKRLALDLLKDSAPVESTRRGKRTDEMMSLDDIWNSEFV
jgi:hypothetical protein